MRHFFSCMLLTLLCNSVFAQDAVLPATPANGSPFDIRDSRNQTWTLPDLSKCEAETFINAEVINAVGKAAIEIEPDMQAGFAATKREALLTNGAITLILNEMARRDEGKAIETARVIAATEAQKLKKEMTDLIDTILLKKDVDHKAAATAQIMLEYNLSLRRIETARCSQSLIILTQAHTLLEDPVGTSVAEPAAPEPVVPVKPASEWRSNIDNSPMTDETRVILMTTSHERLPMTIGPGEYATLILRCAENVTSAFVHFGGAFMSDIQGFGTIDVRIDDQKMRTMNLDVSDNNEALGFFSGGDAIPFIKTLLEGQELRIRATPYNENSILLTFPIAGLEDELKPLRETCGW